MSTERPILFSAEMVRALLAGRKTQTRRLVKQSHCPYNPLDDSLRWLNDNERAGMVGPWPCVLDEYGQRTKAGLKCPYGQAHDRLWVRETCFDTEPYVNAPLFRGASRWLYAADGAFIGCHRWRPSIHMPRAASRITLQIKSIRIERLRDISATDAISEGIEPCSDGWKDYDGSHGYWMDPIDSFRGLWASIHKRGSQYCFGNNPWVWVVDFAVMENQP